jgi:hypothetical protein
MRGSTATCALVILSEMKDLLSSRRDRGKRPRRCFETMGIPRLLFFGFLACGLVWSRREKGKAAAALAADTELERAGFRRIHGEARSPLDRRPLVRLAFT